VKTNRMFVLQGPRQICGVQRWLGFHSRAERDAARRTVARDRAMWDALGPDAIIDREEDGRYRPIRGSNEDCRALARAR